MQYFPGAVQTLVTATREGEWTGEMTVFVTADVEPCARKFLASLGAAVIEINEGEWVGRSIGGKEVWNMHQPDHSSSVVPTSSVPPQPSRMAPANTSTHYAKLALFTDARFRAYSRILFLDADIAVRRPLRILLSRAPREEHIPLALDVYAHDKLYREIRVPLNSLPQAFRINHPNRDGVHQTNVMLIFPQRLPSPERMREKLSFYLDHYGNLINRYYEQGLILFVFYNNTGSFGPTMSAAHNLVISTLEHQFHFRLAWSPMVASFPVFLGMFSQAAAGRDSCFQPTVSLGGRTPSIFTWYTPLLPLKRKQLLSSTLAKLHSYPLRTPFCHMDSAHTKVIGATLAQDPLVRQNIA